MGGALTTEQIAEGREKLVEALKAKATEILERQVGERSRCVVLFFCEIVKDKNGVCRRRRRIFSFPCHEIFGEPVSFDPLTLARRLSSSPAARKQVREVLDPLPGLRGGQGSQR